MSASALQPRTINSMYKVLSELKRLYPNPHHYLRFENPFQLLVATILSAQCTDERVNMVTKDLFRKYPTAAHYAKVSLSELELDIQSTGFFRNKAKSIKGCCQALLEQYDGGVPQNIEQLVELPGIGRKTDSQTNTSTEFWKIKKDIYG